ncbi:MAG: T9SS type A sorting domain-containing protein [Bacteroidetes bacterium]|nr:T9SS type A sorting domain-containing protein [Bacteroidota bacterium]
MKIEVALHRTFLTSILFIIFVFSTNHLRAQIPANNLIGAAILLTPVATFTPINGTTIGSGGAAGSNNATFTAGTPQVNACGSITSTDNGRDVWYKLPAGTNGGFTILATSDQNAGVGGNCSGTYAVTSSIHTKCLLYVADDAAGATALAYANYCVYANGQSTDNYIAFTVPAATLNAAKFYFIRMYIGQGTCVGKFHVAAMLNTSYTATTTASNACGVNNSLSIGTAASTIFPPNWMDYEDFNTGDLAGLADGEAIYSYTATTTGDHQINVSLTNSTPGCYANVFYKLAGLPTPEGNWIPVGTLDGTTGIFAVNLPMVAGSTYYILFDKFGCSAMTATWNIVCPTTPPPLGCNPAGNVFLFSNYDGSGNTVATRLNIDVDVNIPNIKIGICSFERVTVNIAGAFAGNVTKVTYAGFNALGNNHCGSIATTVITGVPAGIISYVIMPPSTYSDPEGYNSIICAYQCTAGNQGGCNTAGQVVGYFLSAFGAGSTFNSHETQYGCWAGAIKKLSTSGNCCMTPLPIELISFNTSKNGDKTVLAKWSTASETNNDFFTIERSKDAFNYDEIGQVKGAGNSNIKQDYSFVDYYPLNGINYYRLKQTDFDGKFAYSEITSINMNDAGNSGFTIFPNPANTVLNCLLYSEEEIDAIFRIKDITGKVLLQDGFKSIKQSIDISSLSAGIYFIEFRSKTRMMQGKFIKE